MRLILPSIVALAATLTGPTAWAKQRHISETEPLRPAPYAVVDSVKDFTAAPSVSVQVAPVSTDPAVVGQWHGLMNWPAVPVHSVVLHTGKLLWWRGDGTTPTSYLWDPITNVLESQPCFDDIFCAGHSQLPDGKILVTGGAFEGTSEGPPYVNIYDPVAKTWSNAPDMRNGRYYPTNLVLGDGRTAIFAGTDPFGNRNLQVEIFRRGGGPGGSDVIDLVSGADRDIDNYPRMHLLPNGKIAHVGPEKYADVFDPATGAWTLLPRVQYGHRSHGSSVMLPGSFTKIMVLGGYDSASGEDVTTATTEIIDLSAATPRWTYGTPMNFRRSHQNAVILPDGKILVAGGTLVDDLEMPQAPGEIYDPVTATWTTVASMSTHRLYHSSAVLLPDGRCLWAGTNSNKTAELYSPPYLFKGPRPVISTTPASVSYGGAFTVTSDQASTITSAVFMRPSANTHSQDMDQRYIPLTYTVSGNTLNLTAPSNPNIAPPGYYLIFILNGQGVPSVGKFIRLGGTGSSTNQAPIVDAGPDQTVTLPAQASLSGSAFDDGLPSPPSLTNTWSKVSGPGTVTFGNASSPSTTASFSIDGTYVLRLTSSDGALSANDTTTITVNPAGSGGGGPGPGGNVVDVRVAVRSDDAEEKPIGGAVNLSSSDLELVWDSADQVVGIRFPNITIPNGATINSAYIQFTADQAQSTNIALTVQGHLTDNASTFTTAAANISSRPRTLASVPWTPAAWTLGSALPAQRTADISAIVREIVRRPGWASGNALAFIISGPTGVTAKRVAASYDALAGTGPLLHIEFGTGGGTGPENQAPFVQAGPDELITLPETASLHGVVTDDGLPTPPSLTLQWTKVSGPGTVTFANPLVAQTTASFSQDGVYVLRLSATDGALSENDSVTITVNPAPGGGDPGPSGVFESRVAVRSDDAEEKPIGGAVNLSSADLELVWDSGDQVVGIRFPNITIPNGATISSAYIQFTAYQAQSTNISLTVQGHLIDNAPTFTTAAANISSRPRTAASVPWTPAAWAIGNALPAQRTADLSTIVREIVSRPGWASGNGMAFIISGPAGVTAKRVAASFDAAAGTGPLLHIEYGGGSTPNQAPQVNAGADQTITLPASASLNGTVTDDNQPAPPSIVTSWTKVSGPGTVTFGNAASRTTTASFSAAGTYVLRLTANDGLLGGEDTLTVTVNPAAGSPNQAPQVNAGADQTITLPASASLNGTVTDDNQPSPPSMVTSWTKVSGPGTVTFGNAASRTTTASFSAAGTYVLRLTANDGLLGGEDTLTVTVNPAAGGGGGGVVDVRITARTDDAEEKVVGGSVSTSSSDLEMVSDGGLQLVGMRFTPIAIPPGAQITNAYIQFTTDEAFTTATSLTFKAQAAGNPVTFSTAVSNISSRATGASSVAWTPAGWPTVGQAGPDQRTPNLSSVIQEVVMRPDWASGNALVIIVTGTGRRTASCTDGTAAAAPLLHVEYTNP